MNNDTPKEKLKISKSVILSQLYFFLKIVKSCCQIKHLNREIFVKLLKFFIWYTVLEISLKISSFGKNILLKFLSAYCKYRLNWKSNIPLLNYISCNFKMCIIYKIEYLPLSVRNEPPKPKLDNRLMCKCI